VRRMKAAMGLFGVKDLEILIAQLVRLKGGARLSKRKGNIITVEDLLDAIGTDAARYFYLTKSLDAQMEFDLALATKKTQSNPVFYIQYTHARTASILAKAKEEKAHPDASGLGQSPQEGELDLMRALYRFADVVEDAARDYQVHRLTTYAYELASEFNHFYRDFRVIEGTQVHAGRLALVAATSMVMKEVLGLLGISAPEKL